MASTYLSRTATANNNSVGKWTFSCWVKRNKIATECNLISFYSDNNYRSALRFDGDDKIRFYEFYNGSTIVAKVTNQLFRDTSGWYHIVFAVDKTVSTPDSQIYINGVATTSWSTNDDYTQNEAGKFDDAETLEINAQNAGGIGECLMAHVHFCDGTTYQASDFGETDSTSGVWKPKTAPSVTYGTNGFFLKFANSASLGTDSSGNGNNFTVNGSGTQTLDTPANVYATFNPLKDGRINAGTQYKATFTNGNTTSTFSETTYNTAAFSTLAVNNGKWYAEIKCSNKGGNTKLGLFSADDFGNNDFSGTYLYDSSGTFGGSAYGNSFTTGDIIQIAFDATNGVVWFGKNGTWQNSATQSEIENGTTTNAAATGIDMTQFWNFGTYGVNATAFQANFGNGYFGTTVISSPNNDGAGEGKFAYTVPTGYYALNTKNLKTYG